MNDLIKQVVEPPRHSSKNPQQLEKWHSYPSLYDKCPECKGIKRRGSPKCRKCCISSRKPPIIPETFIVENELCRKIPLTQGQYTIVDAGLYDWLMQFIWSACLSSDKIHFYAATKAIVDGKRRYLAMHRLILNPQPREDSDHHNGDTLDNRKSNLRACTDAQNQANRKLLQKNNTSGHRGVRWDRFMQKWKSCIRVNGELIILGYFKFAGEAARARDEAAVRLHGKFAKLNFPIP